MEKRYIFYVISAVVLLISFIFDNQIVKFIESMRVETIDIAFIVLSSPYAVYITLLLVAILLYKTKHQILTLLSSTILTYIVVVLLKGFIGRPRPEVSTLVGATASSLPSLHAAIIFMPYALVSKELPSLRIVYPILAFLVAFSRLYNGVHFLSDLIVGGLVGYGVGLLLVDLEGKYNYFEKLLGKYATKQSL